MKASALVLAALAGALAARACVRHAPHRSPVRQ